MSIHNQNTFNSFINELDISSHIKARKSFLISDKYKSMNFEEKIIWAKEKIKEFLIVFNGKTDELPVISFSGGKDSCVLRHLVFEVQKELKMKNLCVSLTGFEIFHPSTLKFIKKNMKLGDEIMNPIKDFVSVINDNGYPVIAKQLAQKISHVRNTKNHRTYIRASLGLDDKSFGVIPLIYCHFLDKEFVDYKVSHKCCDYLKGAVKHDRRPCFIGTTIEESRLRKNTWIKYGCNYFNKEKSMCRPLSLWNERDIWKYIKVKNIKVAPIYKQGYKRSGCMVCMFGMSLEKGLSGKFPKYRNRFELLFDTNRKAFNAFVLGKSIALWKPLTDMNIHLNINDIQYQKLYEKRYDQLIEWYKNFDKNFNKVLDEIETRNPNLWTKKEHDQIFNRYKKSIKIYLKK